jgi:hypothetical protein
MTLLRSTSFAGRTPAQLEAAAAYRASGLSLRAWAASLGISWHTARSWMCGARSPGKAALARIRAARALECPTCGQSLSRAAAGRDGAV